MFLSDFLVQQGFGSYRPPLVRSAELRAKAASEAEQARSRQRAQARVRARLARPAAAPPSSLCSKVCLFATCLTDDGDNYDTMHFFVLDLNSNPNPNDDLTPITPLIRVAATCAVGVCVLDSSLYLFEGQSVRDEKSSYVVDLSSVTPGSILPIETLDQTCTRMHGFKTHPATLRVSDHTILVFSTTIRLRLASSSHSRTQFVDFELFDAVTETFKLLPQFPVDPYPLCDDDDDNDNVVVDNVVEISWYALLGDGSTFLIRTGDMEAFTLNLKSPHSWVKLADGGWSLPRRAFGQTLVVTDELCLIPSSASAYDIREDRVYHIGATATEEEAENKPLFPKYIEGDAMCFLDEDGDENDDKEVSLCILHSCLEGEGDYIGRYREGNTLHPYLTLDVHKFQPATCCRSRGQQQFTSTTILSRKFVVDFLRHSSFFPWHLYPLREY